MEIITIINNTPIKRNFIKTLPYNFNLKDLAKQKRKEGILPEVLFWQQVHKFKFHNLDFDRQRVIGNYIVDFYIKDLGLVVEIDGRSHIGKEFYDAKRQTYIESFGIKFYRISNEMILKNIGFAMLGLTDFIIETYGCKI